MNGPKRVGLRRRAIGAVVAATAVLTGLAGLAPAAGAASTSSSKLGAGRELASGRSLRSPNGEYVLTMQANGNLVERRVATRQLLWATQTAGEPGNHALMQSDGNLVVFGTGGQVRWSSATFGYAGADLRIQSNGNVVIYTPGNRPLWAKSWIQMPSGEQAYARVLFAHYGWSVSTEYPYLNDVWGVAESGWRWNVCNGGGLYPDCDYAGAAYGIPQSDPGDKMATANPDWQTDGLTQVAWGINYIAQAYGTPQAAWNAENDCSHPYCGYINKQ